MISGIYILLQLFTLVKGGILTQRKAEQIMDGGLYLNRFFWTFAHLFPKHDIWYTELSANEIRLAAERVLFNEEE